LLPITDFPLFMAGCVPVCFSSRLRSQSRVASGVVDPHQNGNSRPEAGRQRSDDAIGMPFARPRRRAR
jgi:hypothetical protein